MKNKIYRHYVRIRLNKPVWEVLEAKFVDKRNYRGLQFIDSQIDHVVFASPNRAEAVKVLREHKRRIKVKEMAK